MSKNFLIHNVNQVSIRTSANRWMKELALSGVLILMAIATACNSSGQPSQAEIEATNKAVADIRASLYKPADAELLGEKTHYGTNPKDYPGCVTSHIELAYRSSRSFAEILDDYRVALEGTGWKPSPDYTHNSSDGDIFESGPQTLLSIASFPLREDVLVIPTLVSSGEQQGIIYYVGLSYYQPSRRDCSE